MQVGDDQRLYACMDNKIQLKHTILEFYYQQQHEALYACMHVAIAGSVRAGTAQCCVTSQHACIFRNTADKIKVWLELDRALKLERATCSYS